MSYNNQELEVRIYQHKDSTEEREIILGMDGSADRLKKHDWKETNRFALPGNPDGYLDKFFQENSSIRNLVISPNGGGKPYVGSNPQNSIQFTIAASSEYDFMEIVTAMAQQK
ncbi:hypothetical protein ISS05_02140 [Candidatus Woesearchaeota archaeon]|nr:hypothetical protein [Candidatus Woesearchaeota archaeon]